MNAEWITQWFDFGVWVLVVSARYIGVTYEEINVVIFMLIWPAHIVFTIWLLWKVYKHRPTKGLKSGRE